MKPKINNVIIVCLMMMIIIKAVVIIIINFKDLLYILQQNSSTPAELIMPKQTTPVHIHDKPIQTSGFTLIQSSISLQYYVSCF